MATLRIPKRAPIAVSVAFAMSLGASTAVMGQEEAASGEPMDQGGPTVEVSGVDYAFDGLPTSVPAGTTLTFTNDGTEVHEMIVVRIADETTSLEELMALPEEETADLSEFVGYLSAFPGATADGSVSIATPGRHIALCVINQGSDPARFEALGFDPTTFDPETTDPSTLPPEVQELLAEIESNPQHVELGMIQEFTVTEAGSTPGPLPETEETEIAAEDAE